MYATQTSFASFYTRKRGTQDGEIMTKYREKKLLDRARDAIRLNQKS